MIDYGFRRILDLLHSLPEPGEGELVQVFPLNEVSEVVIGRQPSGSIVVVLPLRDQSPSVEKSIYLAKITFLPAQRISFFQAGQLIEDVERHILCIDYDLDRDEAAVCATLDLLQKQLIAFPTKPYSLIMEEIAALWQQIPGASATSEIGFWGELFTILISPNPMALLNSWASQGSQSFDFIAGDFALEVKASTSTIPVHTFSLSQLINADHLNVVVFSVRLLDDESGVTVEDLLEEVLSIHGLSIDLRTRVLLRYASLGLADSRVRKPRTFSRTIAREESQFVNFDDFPRIEANAEIIEASWSVYVPVENDRTPLPGEHPLIWAK